MEKKKEYGSPELEKLALEDEDLERVTGGAGEEGMEEDQNDLFDHIALLQQYGDGGAGASDMFGLGRGGGCDEVANFRNQRTHSSGRNSDCRGG